MRPLGQVFVFPPLAGCVAVCADASIENVAAAIEIPIAAINVFILLFMGFSFASGILFCTTSTHESEFGS